MEGLHKLDSGDEHVFPVKGPRLTNDIKTSDISHNLHFLALECDWESVDNVVTCYKLDSQGF